MINYNIVRKPRVFEIFDDKGELRMPGEDELIKMYMNLNANYPEIGSEHHSRAEKLDIDFFVNSKYPYDYIVLGDRAAIEEARKGSFLNPYEEAFITLGYGYDGRPFGEPWGIEKECFDGYKYAERNGDFLHWYDIRRYYEIYVKEGHDTPTEYNAQANRDLRELAERRSNVFRKAKYGYITNKIFNELMSNPDKNIIRRGYAEDDLTGSRKMINIAK